MGINDIGELCEIFAKFSSSIANSIGNHYHIGMSRADFVSTMFE